MSETTKRTLGADMIDLSVPWAKRIDPTHLIAKPVEQYHPRPSTFVADGGAERETIKLTGGNWNGLCGAENGSRGVGAACAVSVRIYRARTVGDRKCLGAICHAGERSFPSSCGCSALGAGYQHGAGWTMRFPALARKVRRFSFRADIFLENKWRDWSDIIDQKCRALADFLDPPRKVAAPEQFGPPRPYRPGFLNEVTREALGQYRGRNMLLDAVKCEGKVGASGGEGV